MDGLGVQRLGRLACQAGMLRPFIYCWIVILLLSCGKTADKPAAINGGLVIDSLHTIGSDIPDAFYTDLYFTDAETGIAISQGMAVKTTDGGSSWKRLTLPVDSSMPLRKIQFVDKQTGYIVGGDNHNGYLLKTIDAGGHWELIDLHAMECPYGMYFLNSQTGFVTGKDLFARTDDGGHSWTSLKGADFRMYEDVRFRNGQEGIATSSGGMYFRTVNGGHTWTAAGPISSYFLYDVYFVGDRIYIWDASDSMIDVAHRNAAISRPYGAGKMFFFSDQSAIAIGAHYEQGFFPYGDIFLTNDGWKTSARKTFSTVDAVGFGAIASMSEKKLMILGGGLAGVKVMIFTAP